ncbi:MAG: class I SAM-dependent RNA methyltransferase, partial [Pseudolabrys sp.]|nr:class I SAM-dependent RNA methyltransferase [Pseudolabrys sp.]
MTQTLTIDHIGHRGDGVAETSAGSVFVPYTLPGETVTTLPAEGHPDRAQLLTVDKPSAERVASICPHFGVCGGCALQHWALPSQHDWKRRRVIEALAHEKIEAEVARTVDAHGAGRRRATLHARRATHGVVEVGYTAARSHQIVPIDHCPILAPGMAGTIETAWDIAEALKLTQKQLDIQVTATDTGLDIDVRGSGALSADRVTALAQIATKRRLSRLTRHGETVAQNAPPQIRMGRATMTLPPGSFLQATAAGEETLARLVLTGAGKAKTVADLFCGVGPFALRLAEKARVTAAD